MAITDLFVLPVGAQLLPVRELPEDIRRQMQAGEDDFAISRPNSRVQSKVVDSESAALLRQFETPRTIAQAVVSYSRGRSESAEQLLESAFPLLQSLVAAHLLVPPDSKEASEAQPPLVNGEKVDGWAVLCCMQALEDTELYQTRGPTGEMAALKLARPGCGPAVRSMLNREARILSHLDRTITPALLQTGQWSSRRYLLIEWCSGSDLLSAGEELRRCPGEQSRGRLLQLACSILKAYAHLHGQGIIHGDVHPRNLLVGRDQSVKIIDFGLAQQHGEHFSRSAVQRGGVGFFLEPEFAHATRVGQSPPPASMVGEQYSVAALIYLLVMGSHYLEFSIERDEMLRQIAEDPMLPFAKRGARPWPEVERLLLKALSKQPNDRFTSMSDFAAAWEAVEVPHQEADLALGQDPGLKEMRAELLRNLDLSGALLKNGPLPAPAASVNYGSGGIAYALYRMACATEDAELFALADLWSARALREIPHPGAFYNQELDITPETVGQTSLYHSSAGIYAVQAQIAQARGDILLLRESIRGFIESSDRPSDKLDVTLGRAGTLLGCALLIDDAPVGNSLPPGLSSTEQLRTFGQTTARQLWQTMEAFAPLRESEELSNLGIAHGWAGLLYATLCWCHVANEAVPGWLEERLEQLSALAEPMGRGLRWKWDLKQPRSGYMAGWCNGSAGQVFLWTLAHKMLGAEKYLAQAEGAAWNAWETLSQNSDLCCGRAGQAYSLLNLYRHSGESCWLERAQAACQLTLGAATGSQAAGTYEQPDFRSESLYKGELGMMLLAADLERPEQALMPMFQIGA